MYLSLPKSFNSTSVLWLSSGPKSRRTFTPPVLPWSWPALAGFSFRKLPGMGIPPPLPVGHSGVALPP